MGADVMTRLAACTLATHREADVDDLKIEPLHSIGAQVTGFDWSGGIPDEVAQTLYSAWLEHGVLVFPKAGVTSQIHLGLSRVFGELEEHPLQNLHVAGNKDLIYFGGEESKGAGILVDGELLAGYIFVHQDTAYTPNLCRGSMLRMVQTPPQGGDTIWWDTAKAYLELPNTLKARIETLSTVHALKIVPPDPLWGMRGHTAVARDPASIAARGFPDLPPVLHPMVITHPESGLRSLLLNPAGYVKVEGMDQAEGDALYEQVVSHTLQPKFTYRHHWSVNDIVLWDNRRTMHMATGYPHHLSRMAYRTTLKGAMPTGRVYEGDARAPAPSPAF
jgi:taurine dioxygenase